MVLRSINEHIISNAITMMGIMSHLFSSLTAKSPISMTAVVISEFHEYTSHCLRDRFSERAQSDFRESGGRFPLAINAVCMSIKICMHMKNNPRQSQIQEPLHMRYFVKLFPLKKKEAVATARKKSSIAITGYSAISANLSFFDISMSQLYIIG